MASQPNIVTVEIPSLENVKYSVDHTNFMFGVNLEKIKQELSSKPGVNFDTQVLMFNSRVVKNRHWIGSGAVLQLHDKKLNLTINLPNTQRKKSFTVSVEPTTTVRDLKAIIMANKGISCELQQLKFKDKIIEDNEVLTSYGVLSGSKIDVEVGKNVEVHVTGWTTKLFVPQSYTAADVLETVQSKRLCVRAEGKQLQLQENVLDQIEEVDTIKVEVQRNRP